MWEQLFNQFFLKDKVTVFELLAVVFVLIFLGQDFILTFQSQTPSQFAQINLQIFFTPKTAVSIVKYVWL